MTDIPEARAHLRQRLFDLVEGEFAKRRDKGEVSHEIVAQRLGCSPAVVRRWLESPAEWTWATASDLLLAIANAELGFVVRPLERGGEAR